MENVIMMTVINVHNSGSSQIDVSDYSFQEVEKARWELITRGYNCLICEDLGRLQLVVMS